MGNGMAKQWREEEEEEGKKKKDEKDGLPTKQPHKSNKVSA